MLERFGTPGRLLDIGSAYGHFLANASTNGWQAEGVEPQIEARDLARTRFHLVVHESLAHAPETSYQSATMWHVIEHIPAPKEFLSQVREKLVDGGTLAISTPNIDSLVARATGESWGWLSPPDHLFLYSPTTLPRLLQLSGFELLHIETRRGQSRNTILLMLQALAYRMGLFQRMKQSVRKATQDFQDSGSLTRKLNFFRVVEQTTEFLSIFLYPLLLILWKAGLGDEVVAIARKKN
jgi:SAM-dependent methyltransferase